MFLASNCTCAVYFIYTAHMQLLAKNMAATHVHAICIRICIRNQTNTLRFCREDNPLYVFTLWHDLPNVSVLQLPVRLALKERLLKSSQFRELHSLHKTLTFLVYHLFDNN